MIYYERTDVMSNNIYDTANQLERDLRELPAFKGVKEAYEAIRANKEANDLFDRFREITRSFQNKQVEGEQPTEEEISQLQDIATEVSGNALINKLLQEEEKIAQVIDDINKIVTRPLAEIYQQ